MPSDPSESKKKLVEFYHEQKRMPSYAEMAKLFGYKSKNAVTRLVEKFIDAGIVSKDYLGKLIPEQGFDSIPRLGFVKAGFPASVEELRDTVNLDDLLIKRKDSTYMLDVDGDSMIDAGIHDGDMVLVEKTNRAKDGQIVIARVDGEFTMKYYREKAGKVWLEPANKDFSNIYPERELEVIAKLVTVIRQYSA